MKPSSIQTTHTFTTQQLHDRTSRAYDAGYKNGLAVAEAQNEKLRKALKAIAEFHIPEARNDYQAMARAALASAGREEK